MADEVGRDGLALSGHDRRRIDQAIAEERAHAALHACRRVPTLTGLAPLEVEWKLASRLVEYVGGAVRHPLPMAWDALAGLASRRHEILGLRGPRLDRAGRPA